jgi:hypothetical protein
MLKNINEFYGNKLSASDGAIGHVKDFYFDDKTWAIRYLVADTGSWLTGRQVLLSPHAFGPSDRGDNIFPVNLTRKQIEDSPPIESHKPVSRQYEVEYYRYYGWPAYWNGSAMWGLGSYPMILPPSSAEVAAERLYHHREDRHLQSARAVTGYQVQATDGTIGSVSGFLVDGKSWAIREMAVETGHWYSGKEILVLPGQIERISYEESEVFVTLTQADVHHTAKAEIATAHFRGAIK